MSKKPVIPSSPPGGGGLVFATSFRHHLTGQIVRAKPGKVFCFKPKRKKA